MSGQYVLICDDDGHWYVCPAEKDSEASAVLDAIAAYWRAAMYDCDPPAMPDYLREVGGSPSRVKFREFRIE